MDEMFKTISRLVEEALQTLSRAERQVARVLLADYPSAGLATISMLAQQARVSPPTVLRFTQSLGYSGFTEFQRALLEELTRQSTGPLLRLGNRHSVGSAREIIVNDAGEQARRAIESLARIPEASYEAAVRLLADLSRRIVLVGGRFSSLAANHLGLHLEQIRPGTRILTEPAGRDLGSVVDLSARDVLVLFDFHRFQRSTIELAIAAKKRGCTLLLITDSLECPIAPRADVVLDVTSATDHPFQSDISAFMLTEQLLNVVLGRLGESAHTRLALWEQLRERELLP